MTAVAGADAVVADVRIARGVELAPVLRRTGGDETGVEEFRADQLVVAMRDRIKPFAGNAAAGKRGWCAGVGQAAGRIESRYAGTIDAVGEGWIFRPDAAVDDADDHVFALDERTAGKLRPQAASCGQAQEARGRHRVEVTRQVSLHVRNGGVTLERKYFGVGQHGGKAVQHDVIGGNHGGIADRGEHFALAVAQIAHILLHVVGAEVERSAGGWLGCGQAGDAAGISGGGLVLQLHDVGTANFLGDGADRGAGQQDQRGERDWTQIHLHGFSRVR